MILSCPALATDVKPFEVYPLLRAFPVLGKATGFLTEQENTRCLTVNAIELFVNEGVNDPVSVTGIRFGLGVRKGNDDWDIAGRGELYPFGVQVSPHSTVSIPGTLVSCFAGRSTRSEIEWIFMEIRMEDASGIGYSYMHSVEFDRFVESVSKPLNGEADADAAGRAHKRVDRYE